MSAPAHVCITRASRSSHTPVFELASRPGAGTKTAWLSRTSALALVASATSERRLPTVEPGQRPVPVPGRSTSSLPCAPKGNWSQTGRRFGAGSFHRFHWLRAGFLTLHTRDGSASPAILSIVKGAVEGPSHVVLGHSGQQPPRAPALLPRPSTFSELADRRARANCDGNGADASRVPRADV